jgi:pentatricopeptide repeat protein
MLQAADLNPWELVYLVGAYAHLGDADGALDLLRDMLKRGRCVSRAWTTALAPSLRSAAGLTELVREYRDVEERRRRRLRTV